jgi:N utilization substance protein B
MAAILNVFKHNYRGGAVDDQINPSMCSDQEFDDRDPEQWRSFAELSIRAKRALVFHILYAADAYDYAISAQAIVDMFNKGFEIDIPVESDLVQTACAIMDNRVDLDIRYQPYLTNWRAERLGVSTKLILRYAIWEMLNTQTSPSIVINEAVELAKCYAERDAYKFINGILDELLKTLPSQSATETAVPQ